MVHVPELVLFPEMSCIFLNSQLPKGRRPSPRPGGFRGLTVLAYLAAEGPGDGHVGEARGKSGSEAGAWDPVGPRALWKLKLGRLRRAGSLGLRSPPASLATLGVAHGHVRRAHCFTVSTGKNRAPFDPVLAAAWGGH